MGGKALRRLHEEEGRDVQSNPKVKVEDMSTAATTIAATTDECIDDPKWAEDCPHVADHCGSSIVMKARCRKTCGCGPKVDIFIPSLADATGAGKNATKPAGNGTKTEQSTMSKLLALLQRA